MGKALAHCMEGILHCARADRFLVGGDAAITIPLGKELDEEDGVIDIHEGIISAKGLAESLPDSPCVIMCEGM